VDPTIQDRIAFSQKPQRFQYIILVSDLQNLLLPFHRVPISLHLRIHPAKLIRTFHIHDRSSQFKGRGIETCIIFISEGFQSANRIVLMVDIIEQYKERDQSIIQVAEGRKS
jgi:hypothetical protein